MTDADNPYYCLSCNNEYKEQKDDKRSIYVDDYCRYLGYCGLQCWDNQTQQEKHEAAELAILVGAEVKKLHKFKLLNEKHYR